ncbi:tRNA1(Val) (adenine(37)-N6)-methyltransferase [Christiangramia salexigens]|uniref:tRNA1(Val) (adenine(37)-N6)-methyltransferase n=1 Tax=Christiangramia salexigens TaxID=1913577 RepID=A0A1L3J5Q7_9FLAO|nr:methyltransferase [Christiangramia salexigens]APG60451.1 tRNA (adenine-N(6)-)-methyltransferase [Christiangramia salexigens]
MSNKPFKFKQFSVSQDRCAMKIGTDGVLLGAWSSLKHQPESILDIGTGTGVIALMLAQRSDAGLIDALEIEENAYEQAVENFEQSDWGDRLFCYHAGFDEFVDEMKDEEAYDLIISNPPFYSEDYKSGNDNRDQARFADALPLTELIEGASLLLSDNGHFDLIIPFGEEKTALQIAASFNLFPRRITRVKGTESSPVKRSLISFSFDETRTAIDELVLEVSRHNYTEEFKNLVSDFYLKL